MTYKKKRPSSKLGRSLFVGIALEHYFHGEAAIEKVIVHAFPVWWSRGESNPCPKATWKELLRAQFVIYIPSSRREQTPYGNQ